MVVSRRFSQMKPQINADKYNLRESASFSSAKICEKLYLLFVFVININHRSIIQIVDVINRDVCDFQACTFLQII